MGIGSALKATDIVLQEEAEAIVLHRFYFCGKIVVATADKAESVVWHFCIE